MVSRGGTADSLALRGFLGLGLDEVTPEHSTISRTRRLIDVETHRAVFTWILHVLATADLIRGKTIGINATTLEANAAPAEHRATRFGRDLSGVSDAARAGVGHGHADAGRLGTARSEALEEKGATRDWRHPHDPEARITKMKDGRTHLAHKAEHAVDLETGAIVGVTVQGADQGDTTTIAETVTTAADELEAGATVTDEHTAVIDEVVADKGYHSNQTLVDLAQLDVRTYIAEPNRAGVGWKHKAAARAAVHANRRRIRGRRGCALQRCRSERLERPNAHLSDTGGMRRTHLRGHDNILTRLLVHTGGFKPGPSHAGAGRCGYAARAPGAACSRHGPSSWRPGRSHTHTPCGVTERHRPPIHRASVVTSHRFEPWPIAALETPF